MSVGGLLWDYRSPSMKVLSGVVVMIAKEIPEQAKDMHIRPSGLRCDVIQSAHQTIMGLCLVCLTLVAEKWVPTRTFLNIHAPHALAPRLPSLLISVCYGPCINPCPSPILNRLILCSPEADYVHVLCTRVFSILSVGKSFQNSGSLRKTLDTSASSSSIPKPEAIVTNPHHLMEDPPAPHQILLFDNLSGYEQKHAK